MAYRSVFRPDLFAGQVVVTGAGSGIGRCTAHELAALGARTVLIGRTPEKLAAVVDEIRADGGAPTARRHWPLLERKPTQAFDGFHRGKRPRVLEE
jgi:citronellol/citronellal dehydrogenase